MNRHDTAPAPLLDGETPHQTATADTFYRLLPDVGYTQAPLYQVIPVSHGFFHIRKVDTGEVKGFRCTHNGACELARHLENTDL